MWMRFAEYVNQEFSDEQIQAHINYITQFYRYPGSSGFHSATKYVEQKFIEYNIEVQTKTYPLDGKRVVYGRSYPHVWEPISAQLKISSPVEEELVSFKETPSCIPWWCGSTPPEGVSAELIDVGEGDSSVYYDNKDIQGNVVLVSHSSRNESHSSNFLEAWKIAVVERGAIGIISDLMVHEAPPVKTRENVPELVQLLRIRPPIMRDQWALSISYTTGQKLRALLKKGPVKIWANIQTKSFVGEGKNVLATIPGNELPEEEVLLVAHTSTGTKPGANCAAGVTLVLEVARIIKNLVDLGKIAPPKRSIKFLIGPEGPVSMEYLQDNEARLDRIISALCFCGVGNDQKKTKSALTMGKCPDSLPHFINDFCESLIEKLPKEAKWLGKDREILPLVNFTVIPYTAWSDNHNFVSFGVPCPVFTSFPDLYYHSQFLTPDIIDLAVIKRCGLVIAVATLILANAGVNEAVSILKEVATRSEVRLSRTSIRAFEKIVQYLSDLDPEHNSAQEIEQHVQTQLLRGIKMMQYSRQRDIQAIESVMSLIQTMDDPTKHQLEKRAKTLKAQLKQKCHLEEQTLRELTIDALNQVKREKNDNYP